jgi:hypothetical protein
MLRRIRLNSAIGLAAVIAALWAHEALGQTSAQVAPASSAGAPAAVSPREVADRIGVQIEEGYFDPTLGKALADGLRAEAAKGAFDRLTDPRDLATALTAYLRPKDAHFSVQWAPGNGAVGPATAGAPQGDRQHAFERQRAALARANYGFRKVEILPGDIGYIALDQFAPIDPSNPKDPARGTADAVLATIANTQAVIIDLRDNGGGSPAMVGYLVANFVPAGAKIYNTFRTRGKSGYEGPPFPPTLPARLDVPIYILTSGRTGSAAEAFPYTLQAAKRATIVGETTGGAAHPGGPRDAGGGFSVFVSNGSPINPITKTNWEGVGVKPDVAVPAAQALVKAQLLALETGARSPNPDVAEESRWVLESLSAGPVAGQTLDDYAGTYSGRILAVEGGRLALRFGARPPLVLVPLGPDLFFVEGAPLRRMRFERGASGQVTALEIFGPGGGPTQRLARTTG